MNYLKKRAKEPSSWAGLGLLVTGIGTLLKANGVPEAGQAIAQTADQLAAGDYMMPITMIISGLLAAVLGEKGKE